jgi:hypothetical protein
MQTTNFKTLEEIYSDIKENILNMSYSEIVTLHNEYCRNMAYYDDEIFDNDPYIINEIFSDTFKALQNMFYGKYNPNHDFFQFDGYGNLQSIEDYNVLDYIDINGIVSQIFEDPYNYVAFINFLTPEYFENIEFLKQD